MSEFRYYIRATMNLINCLMGMTCLLINLVAGQLIKGDACSVNNGDGGICKLIPECPAAIVGLQKLIYPQICGFEGIHVVVCCAKVSNSTMPEYITTETSVITPKATSTAATQVKPIPISAATTLGKRPTGIVSHQKCVEYSQYVWAVEINPILTSGGAEILRMECPFSRPLIVDNVFAVRRELPHMVQLGYDTRYGPSWLCGGSLISDEYVLTSGHCLSHELLGDVKYARMGIIDSEEDDHMQQYNISEIVYHPEYEALLHYNDIGLVRLDTRAYLNSWVRPACLYTNNASPMSKVIASGWITTYNKRKENSFLQKLILELYDNPGCNKNYSMQAGSVKPKEEIKDEIMICAGSSKDLGYTCQGIFNGPIQIYGEGDKQLSCMYDIVGVASIGRACGLEVNTPAVYTRVSAYTKWIEDIVWPST